MSAWDTTMAEKAAQLWRRQLGHIKILDYSVPAPTARDFDADSEVGWKFGRGGNGCSECQKSTAIAVGSIGRQLAEWTTG